MIATIFTVLFIIVLFVWAINKFQEWFSNTFPKITESINVFIGAIAFWVLATVFFGFFGFLFILLLYAVLIMDDIYYKIVNLIKNLFK